MTAARWASGEKRRRASQVNVSDVATERSASDADSERRPMRGQTFVHRIPQRVECKSAGEGRAASWPAPRPLALGFLDQVPFGLQYHSDGEGKIGIVVYDENSFLAYGSFPMLAPLSLHRPYTLESWRLGRVRR